MKSALAVPSRAGERVGAVLAFYSCDDDAFTETHQRIAEAAASVVAAVRMDQAVPASLGTAA
jgi:hypothetical protein